MTLDKVSWLAPFPSAQPTIGFSTAIGITADYPQVCVSLAQAHVPDPYLHRHNPLQPLEEAVWRTLIGDRTHSSRTAPASCGRAIRTASQNLRNLSQRQMDGHTPNFVEEPPSRLQRLLGLTPEQQVEMALAVLEFAEVDPLYDFSKDSFKFIFSVTEKGYIAMVPGVSKVGDTVRLIDDVPVPFVLRAVSGDDMDRTKKRSINWSVMHMSMGLWMGRPWLGEPR